MEPSPKIFLGGGGSEEDEAKIWDVVFNTNNENQGQLHARMLRELLKLVRSPTG